MDINRSENFEAKNPFFEERFVSKYQLYPIKRTLQLPDEGERRAKVKATQKPKGPEQLTPAQLRAKLKDEVDKRKKATEREKRQKARKKKQRDFEKKHLPKNRERLGERLKPYIDAIGKAFEKLKNNPGKLYDFISGHDLYMAKKKGVLQNYEQWNEDFYKAFELKPINRNIPKEKEYGIYAGALQFYLSKYFDKTLKIDVFDLVKGRRANPFMGIDDKIGAYTVSVLTAYWNRNFAGKFKLKGKTIGRLDYANLAKEYGAKRKNQAVFDDAIAELSRKLKEKPPKRRKPKPRKPKPKPQEKETDREKKAHRDKEWNDAMNRIKKPGKYQKLAEHLTKAMLIAVPDKITRKRFEEEFNDLRDTYGGDPEKIRYLSKYTSTAPIYQKNWSYLIFQKYKEAYNREKNNPIEANKKRLDDLYVMLKGSANDFYGETKKIIDKLKKKYETNLAILAGLYDLPHNVGIANLSPVIKTYKRRGNVSFWEEEENPQYKQQREKVLSKHLRQPEAIDAFFKKYFQERPKRTFKTPEELSKSLTKPIKDIREFIGVSPEGIKDRINHIILLRNMHTVHWTSDWYKQKFNKELKAAKATMLASYETYYKKYKGKKGKDFTGDILAGKLKK